MATSGTATFNPTQYQIIKRAGRQVGAWAAGETPGADEMQDFSDALNAMIKEWQASGLHLWAECQGILFLAAGQTQYLLGPNSTDHSAQSYLRTTMLANLSSGNTINVASLTGNSNGAPIAIANGMTIGVYTNANALFWSTVTGTGGTAGNYTVTLADALPSAGVSIGMPVVAYTTALQRPLRIIASRRLDLISLLETPIQTMARQDYFDLPNKMDQGLLNTAFYDPQMVNGVVSVWQNPQDSQFAHTFTWMRQLQDITSPTDTADFPQEWVNCLTWNLAEQMMPEYSLSNPLRVATIQKNAADSKATCLNFDREPESVFVGVNFDENVR